MKSNPNHYTPAEFAKIFHIDKQTLIYYDNQGIFSPAYKSPKGYRYYDTKQILPFAELLSLRNLELPGTALAEFHHAPHRRILMEMLSDKIMEYEETIASLERRIECLRGKMDRLAKSRALPAEQILVIPRGTLYAQKSPRFPAGTSLRDACLASAPLVAAYGAHHFERNLQLALMPETEHLQDLTGPIDFHMVLLSETEEEMENPITYPPSLYLTYIFPHNLSRLDASLTTHLEEMTNLLSLSITSPIFFTQLLSEEGEPNRCQIEIAVKHKRDDGQSDGRRKT